MGEDVITDFSGRTVISQVLFVYATCCEFVAESGRTLHVANVKFDFWWGWRAEVHPSSDFKGALKCLSMFL